MKTRRYAAIVLAAGLSTRMRDFKPLLRVGGETITDRVISIFETNGVEVLLVTGWQRHQLASGIRNRGITLVENPDYESGMFSSVKAGISHLSSSHRAFFIMPVDIPLVRPATVKRLLETAVEHLDNVIYPVFKGRRGHPPLIPSGLAPDIMGWVGEGGLKSILALRSPTYLDVNVPDENILLDMNRQEDFVALVERYRRYDIPSEQECRAILDIAGTAGNIRAHCFKVAEVATAVAEALTAAGHTVDVEVIRAAALLHDVAKEYWEHDIEGGRMLDEFGFARVGDIVARHTDLAGDTAASLEARIVYLADKFVRDEELVSIEDRYLSASRKHIINLQVANKIEQGKKQALRVKKEIETLLGYPLDRILLR